MFEHLLAEVVVDDVLSRKVRLGWVKAKVAVEAGRGQSDSEIVHQRDGVWTECATDGEGGATVCV